MTRDSCFVDDFVAGFGVAVILFSVPLVELYYFLGKGRFLVSGLADWSILALCLGCNAAGYSFWLLLCEGARRIVGCSSQCSKIIELFQEFSRFCLMVVGVACCLFGFLMVILLPVIFFAS